MATREWIRREVEQGRKARLAREARRRQAAAEAQAQADALRSAAKPVLPGVAAPHQPTAYDIGFEQGHRDASEGALCKHPLVGDDLLLTSILQHGSAESYHAGYHRGFEAAAADLRATGSFVYYIATPRHVKIGVSVSPWRRLSSLQTANAEDLTMLAMEPGSATLEASRHVQFASIRERGEWFRRTAWVEAHATALCALARADPRRHTFQS